MTKPMLGLLSERDPGPGRLERSGAGTANEFALTRRY